MDLFYRDLSKNLKVCCSPASFPRKRKPAVEIHVGMTMGPRSKATKGMLIIPKDTTIVTRVKAMAIITKGTIMGDMTIRDTDTKATVTVKTREDMEESHQRTTG